MIKNITNVRGFTCWGAHSGVKSLRRDLAIIYSEVPASIGAVFTQNQVVAEPIKVSREHAKNGLAQAIVINAGNANACTGEQGYEGAMAMVKATAETLKIDEELVIVSSTGVIGEPFPTEDIVEGIKENAPKVTSRSSAGSFAANAILTTDTFAKEGFLEFSVDGREVNLAGIAKGSGMIHPNMATMLAFIVTDVDIEPALLQKAVSETVDDTFNMITVDGDTSTNDMVAVMANGKAGNERLTSEKSKDYKVFRNHLQKMMQHLAKLIVSDGEGSSKFVEYRVENAPDKTVARKLARAISSSNLVKTAMFGRDPNWGRIVSAAGNAGVTFDYTGVDLYLGNEKERVKVLEKGKPVNYDRNFMKKLLRESHISVKMDMCDGEAKAVAWGSDLTTDYVLFNSVYTT
ncbi:bifunctional glutamate N-acetyltransferase/amino-acid acetyltransferase ArgJ [Natronogracilivirga saccharolytica]|uniref:Arginine biosynthesis bifunctional protein ArgJ n=1 Tax=Natronogracilivirga saccharolytica TaxID=2812953 RepID=A0A8J7RL31_9BACT|nr:bifunctional glutamate N-acetyltransferase/amino-acid acetyltransferase ArgJ [Natronogracilivirga saccharolytica]MBP3193282.1 bifunctional glutamate N-acetyltransferase/amino-acid acetyltransferase ArgJ [Natronogracilivirga saccharolytica]